MLEEMLELFPTVLGSQCSHGCAPRLVSRFIRRAWGLPLRGRIGRDGWRPEAKRLQKLLGIEEGLDVLDLAGLDAEEVHAVHRDLVAGRRGAHELSLLRAGDR